MGTDIICEKRFLVKFFGVRGSCLMVEPWVSGRSALLVNFVIHIWLDYFIL